MLKLLSRVLLARISGVLARAQSVDKAGIKSKFGCENHLFYFDNVAGKVPGI